MSTRPDERVERSHSHGHLKNYKGGSTRHQSMTRSSEEKGGKTPKQKQPKASRHTGAGIILTAQSGISASSVKDPPQPRKKSQEKGSNRGTRLPGESEKAPRKPTGRTASAPATPPTATSGMQGKTAKCVLDAGKGKRLL